MQLEFQIQLPLEHISFETFGLRPVLNSLPVGDSMLPCSVQRYSSVVGPLRFPFRLAACFRICLLLNNRVPQNIICTLAHEQRCEFLSQTYDDSSQREHKRRAPQHLNLECESDPRWAMYPATLSSLENHENPISKVLCKDVLFEKAINWLPVHT